MKSNRLLRLKKKKNVFNLEKKHPNTQKLKVLKTFHLIIAIYVKEFVMLTIHLNI